MGAGPEPQPTSELPAPAAGKRTLVFTYGTLKRGFSNHALLQDLFLTGDAAFVGAASTASPLPLVCGPYRVPFLLNLPGSGHRVKGELYSVTARGLGRLDELEGVSRGHYERLPVEVLVEGKEQVVVEGEAVAYYAHRGYAAELWARSGRRGHAEYSPAVAAGYVRRVDRPQNLTGDAAFVGAASTASPLPLVCGPYRVPFLLNLPGSGHRVKGELYSVTARGLGRLDELEGVSRGHYERLPVEVLVEGKEQVVVEGEAVAYYAHRGYAAELWARSGRRGHAEYSPAVAAGYVRRVDRPQNLTFLEQIRVFVSSQS